MGDPTNSDLAKLAILNSGQYPLWTNQPVVNYGSLTGPPEDADDGVSLGESVVADFRLQLRRNPAVRRTDITLTVDGTPANNTFTLTINGNAYAAAGNADVPTTLGDLKTVIDLGSEPGMTTTVINELANGGPQILRIEADDYTCVESVAGIGAGTISVADLEATTATFRVHLMPTDIDRDTVVRLTLDGTPANNDFTVTIDGVDFTTAGNTDQYTTLGDLATLIDATSSTNISTEVNVDSTGTLLRITGNSDADVAVSETGTGVGTITSNKIDYKWDHSSGIIFTTTTNWTERGVASSYSRAFIEVTATDGNHIVPGIGPCTSPF